MSTSAILFVAGLAARGGWEDRAFIFGAAVELSDVVLERIIGMVMDLCDDQLYCAPRFEVS